MSLKKQMTRNLMTLVHTGVFLFFINTKKKAVVRSILWEIGFNIHFVSNLIKYRSDDVERGYDHEDISYRVVFKSHPSRERILCPTKNESVCP